MQNIDVAVIGAGPAGLTAGIYLGRAHLKAVIFEKAVTGGQMAVSDWIENFPGVGKGTSGADLADSILEQAVACGAKVAEEEIVEIKIPRAKEKSFLLKTQEANEYQALAVIVAAGAYPKRLNVPGEDKFAGRGVSYCATCDAPLFKDKTVLVVGGGDTAVQEAVFLAKYAKKVYLVHRRDRFRAAKALAERIASSKNIEPVWNSVVTEIMGGKKAEAVVIKKQGSSEAGQSLQCDGVFIFAGITPNSNIANNLIKLDKNGYIITDEDMKTTEEGIFACGDVRKKLLRQIVTACGEAATAAVSAQHYVEGLRGNAY